MGSLWSGVDATTFEGKLQQSFGMTFLCIFTGQSTFAAAPQYIVGRLLLNRERASGTYDTLSSYVAKIIVETPIFFTVSSVFGPIVYW